MVRGGRARFPAWPFVKTTTSPKRGILRLADPAFASPAGALIFNPRIRDEGPTLAGRSALPAKIRPRASSQHVPAVAGKPPCQGGRRILLVGRSGSRAR